ncbi:hypothetical protein HanPI659440_Chr14g0565351 [Helianthus annuus]|nr:hypothetical protein HanPI659440_Chr14g0565351 [Helianthus annuus]
MGKQKLQDIYLKLDRSVYEEGSSSKTKFSKLPTIPEEGIFVRKAQYEKPLSPRKRSMIIKKSKEQIREKRIKKETQELINKSPWEDKLDEK